MGIVSGKDVLEGLQNSVHHWGLTQPTMLLYLHMFTLWPVIHTLTCCCCCRSVQVAGSRSFSVATRKNVRQAHDLPIYSVGRCGMGAETFILAALSH